eukprot:1427803-Pyramimonas_sp.AAC.2
MGPGRRAEVAETPKHQKGPTTMQDSPREAASARTACARRTLLLQAWERNMLTSKSNRPPLKVQFSFQANMATFPLRTIQDSPRAAARAHARRTLLAFKLMELYEQPC